jgi:Zn-dependent M28 family amino/carboxypeptidase
MRYGGQSASLANQTVVHIPNHGCHISDFVGVANKVALIEEPVSSQACDIWDSAWNAEQANATAIIYYNAPTRTSLLYSRVRITDWKKGDPLMTIPVLASSRSVGLVLKGAESHVQLDITTKTQITIEDTHNTLCVGRVGNDSQRIVIGAHLDSVPAGPGLVDNGSGSSSLLEMAIILSERHQHFLPHSKLVFAFWGAEEIGLLGSREWVRSTRRDSPREWIKIAANINLDMLASPNFISLVHNGEDAPESVRNASIQIQKAFETFFNLEKLPYKLESMTAGSDFLPFLLNDIPSGTLFSIYPC